MAGMSEPPRCPSCGHIGAILIEEKPHGRQRERLVECMRCGRRWTEFETAQNARRDTRIAKP
jgi:transcriptional regulator NrdR family protein